MAANTHAAGFIELLLLVFGTLGFPCNPRARAGSSLPTMPLPTRVVQGGGEFLIVGNFRIAVKGYKEPRLERARRRFLNHLSSETGMPLWR